MTLHFPPTFAFIVLVCMPASAQPPSADDTAIREVVRRYADAREARDPEAVAALFTADADQLVSSGEWRRGRDVLVKGTMASSAQNTGQRTITVETLRMIGPDVAIADARYEIRGAETRRMWSTFVMARQQGQWRISAIRNMLPAMPAATAPPVAASERDAILAVVDRFMQAVSTNDAALFSEIRIPETMNIVERPADGGGTRHREHDVDRGARRLPGDETGRPLAHPSSFLMTYANHKRHREHGGRTGTLLG